MPVVAVQRELPARRLINRQVLGFRSFKGTHHLAFQGEKATFSTVFHRSHSPFLSLSKENLHLYISIYIFLFLPFVGLRNSEHAPRSTEALFGHTEECLSGPAHTHLCFHLDIGEWRKWCCHSCRRGREKRKRITEILNTFNGFIWNWNGNFICGTHCVVS